MPDTAKIHDQRYKALRAAHHPGWGGENRISKLPQMLEERFFSSAGIPTSGKLLELGCGAGNLSILLSNKGFDVTGVDFSEYAIQWSKDNALSAGNKINFKIADVTNLIEFKNSSFDVLYDGNCLHCIIGPKRASALSEWKRLLKPKGILFISSLCSSNENSEFPTEFDNNTRVLSESGYPYRYIPTPEMLESELVTAGFKIINSKSRIDHPFGHINIHAVKLN